MIMKKYVKRETYESFIEIFLKHRAFAYSFYFSVLHIPYVKPFIFTFHMAMGHIKSHMKMKASLHTGQEK